MDHAVVLAGGSGTRFWPESRMRRSKQFLNLTGEGPMIAETVRRLLPLVPRENIWVVAGEKDSPHLSARGLGVPPGNILLEPEGRNPAPAVALAAARIERRDTDAVIAATPADHAVADAASFRSALRKGFRLARRTCRFVTLGISPSHPATGYGYIERGAPFRGGGKGVYLVRRFTEKPDLRTARRFLRSGRFYWNSGVFLVRAATYRDRMARFLPPVHRRLERAVRDSGKKGFRDRLHRAYAGMPSVSVDYGILEKEDGILVIPSEFGWNDIGTWRSLHEFQRSLRRLHRHRVARPPVEEGPPHRRGDRDEVLLPVGNLRDHQHVADLLPRLGVFDGYLAAETRAVFRDGSHVDPGEVGQPLLNLGETGIQGDLPLLGRFVLAVLRDVPVRKRRVDLLRKDHPEFVLDLLRLFGEPVHRLAEKIHHAPYCSIVNSRMSNQKPLWPMASTSACRILACISSSLARERNISFVSAVCADFAMLTISGDGIGFLPLVG